MNVGEWIPSHDVSEKTAVKSAGPLTTRTFSRTTGSTKATATSQRRFRLALRRVTTAVVAG